MQHISVPSHPILNGSVAALLTFALAFNTTGAATGVKKCTIRASAKEPVLLEIYTEVTTPFNAATTNVVTVGSDAATSDQFLAAGDINEGAAGFSTTKKVRIVADTDIYVKYTQTGTAATTGAGYLYINVTPLPPIPPVL